MVKFMGFVGEGELADILDAHRYRWRKDEVTGEDFGASGEVLSA
ncbi:MAG: hypothetical protein ACOH1Q_08345 [Thiobacillus sp.]